VSSFGFGLGFGRRFKRNRDGSYTVRLPVEERELLRSLPGQLRTLLTDAGADGDPALERLFPPAFGPSDVERNAEYASLMRDDLRSARLTALSVMESSVDRTSLSEDELAAWLGALNDLRLVFGTRLDVTDDMDAMDDLPPDDPLAPAFALYYYLTWLQEQVVQALAGSL
jgi:hypothetical protein